MNVKVTRILPASADQVWAKVKRSDTLVFICHGLLAFDGSDNFPETWFQGHTEQVRLRFFGLIPAWQHHLHFKRLDDDEMKLVTEEGGGLVPTWNHTIAVEALDADRCRYTDEIDIRAGLLTPIVALYAHLFYRYRQWRWKRLLMNKTNLLNM